MNRTNTVRGRPFTGFKRQTAAPEIPEEARREGEIRRRIEDIREAARLEREFAADEYAFTEPT